LLIDLGKKLFVGLANKKIKNNNKLNIMRFKKILLAIAIASGLVTGYSQPFIEDIQRFKAIDSETLPPQHAILFIGSSSFTMWYDVSSYFPEYTIINRAFGGSTLEDLIRYVDDIVFPYAPSKIVIYCGENDFAVNDTVDVEMVTQRFYTLFGLIRNRLPQVPISYVSMKPSPLRWNLAGKFREANGKIETFIKLQPNTRFINVWDSMLNADGVPDKDIFLDDMLHMNAKGYAIWQKLIEPSLTD
jgi:lysophospholipase L1-like esterase